MFFHWCLCDSKSPKVSRTLLRILAELNNLNGLHKIKKLKLCFFSCIGFILLFIYFFFFVLYMPLLYQIFLFYTNNLQTLIWSIKWTQVNPTVMVPTLWTIMNSSYYYEYQENIHLDVKLILAGHLWWCNG